MAVKKPMKVVIRAKYEEGGPWYSKPERLIELFNSNLELVVEYKVGRKLNAVLSTQLIGKRVIIGTAVYKITQSGLK